MKNVYDSNRAMVAKTSEEVDLGHYLDFLKDLYGGSAPITCTGDDCCFLDEMYPSFETYRSWRRSYPGWSFGPLTKDHIAWRPEYEIGTHGMNRIYLEMNETLRFGHLPKQHKFLHELTDSRFGYDGEAISIYCFQKAVTAALNGHTLLRVSNYMGLSDDFPSVLLVFSRIPMKEKLDRNYYWDLMLYELHSKIAEKFPSADKFSFHNEKGGYWLSANPRQVFDHDED